MGIQYKLRDVGDVTVIDLMGQLTLASMPPYSGETGVVISDIVHDLADRKKKKLLLNLGDVTYIDSCGIGHIVQAVASARRKNLDIRLANPAAPVFALLRITHLEKIVDIAESEAAGIAAFGKTPAKKK